jgi:hypothetical protein
MDENVMVNRTRWLTKRTAVGGGIAITIAVLVGVFYWYRIEHPKPWNNSAIRASYYRIGHYGDKLAFEYVLENTTKDDLRLTESDKFDIAIRVADTDSLRGFDSKQTTLQLPVYLPAKHKTTITVETPEYAIGAVYPGAQASKEEKDQFYRTVAEQVSEKLSNWNGFVLFVQKPRYEIDLPNGWKTQTQSSAKSGRP